MTEEGQFDIILWGGSSFVGRLVAEHLYAKYGLNGSLRWAIGGRNEQKLAATRAKLGSGAKALTLLVGDAHDPGFLSTMVKSTKVVLSTVGPYRLYGGDLIEACVSHGTDYCDLSGEVTFIREMMDLHSERARASGSRLLSCCGIDSLPSDLGVYILSQFAQKYFDSTLAEVTNEVTSFRGGFSGGTLLSLGLMRNAAAADKETAEILSNPYAICPAGRRSGVPQVDVDAVVLSDTGRWLGPFFMAIINTRVVHATNALLDYPYGPDFTYVEGMNVGGRIAAKFLEAASGAFYWAYRKPMLRRALEKLVLPKTGEGPSKAARESGHFEFRLYGRTRSDHRLQLVVSGDRDPGYGASSRMIGEVAVCLAKDLAKEELPGGFWTPGAAIADKLTPRLIANAGIKFRLSDHAGDDHPVSSVLTSEKGRLSSATACQSAEPGKELDLRR